MRSVGTVLLTGARPWLSTLALLVLWQALATAGALDPRTLPGPDVLARTAAELLRSGELAGAVGVSLARVAAGTVLGVGLGLAAGLLAGLSRLAHDVVDRPVQMVRTVPFTALVPLFLLWFGLGETPKVALVVVATAVPLYLNTVAGVRGVDHRLVEVARVNGLSRWRTVRRVLLPGALPSVLVGLRFALGVAWVAVIVAETVNADRGVGHLLTTGRTYARTDVVVVCIALYAALGALTDAAVRALEARLLRWRTPATG
ncbi:ABC transporter permease [Kineococcus sp. SYSU DK004]|uniref:ABC transporter permease n=1 Tax=Kineococcus sp. SYSU DK004 TaxID=3383125 RepID=UPI003D7CA424